MTAPLRYIIEAKRRGRGAWKVLTEAGTLTSERERAMIVTGKRAAEAALARNRGLMPTAIWRILEYHEAPKLALQRA